MTEIEFSSEMEVELIDTMGSDLRIVNAARISTDKQHSEFTPADQGLIRRLIKDGHGTPFEKVRFEFIIEVPIFIARQWFKHRFSSFNEVSGRYTDYKPKFYIPRFEFVRGNVGKRMDYHQEPLNNAIAHNFINHLEKQSLNALKMYENYMSDGVAGEVARLFIPMNMYTKFMWGIDLRNLTNFLVLRDDKHASWEIQEAAKKVDKAFEQVCPETYKIWHEEGGPRLAAQD